MRTRAKQVSRWLTRSFVMIYLVAGGLLLIGCRGVQSALDPAGPQASRIGKLWWFLFAVCLAVYACVVGFLLYAVLRSRRPDAASAEADVERRMNIVVTGAVIGTAVILFVFLIVSVVTGRAVSALPNNAVTIEVVGHQWWWEVHYPDPMASQTVVTANELHVPVGQPVILKVTSYDVIHSFWIPNLQGKIDLIPSHINTVWFQADRPGVFRGQCAEFCGLQHANMAFIVVAEPPEQFHAWLDQQRRPAAEPTDPVQQQGKRVFLSSPCVLCHTIRGTGAFGQVAPDLTHLASRQRIAAGTLPNTRGHLAGWIVDSQNIKPGNRMPPMTLTPDNLEALLAYLASLN